jgi:hypothetical protein
MRETSTSEGGNYLPQFCQRILILKISAVIFFTCRKSGTWDILFYFPSEGRHTVGFSDAQKIQRFEPANSGSSGQYANHWTTEAVINNTNTTAHKFAKRLNTNLNNHLHLSNLYNTTNSNDLPHELVKVHINSHHRLLTLDSKHLYANVPIQENSNLTKT